MPEPLVVQVMNEFKRGLLLREQDQMTRMAQQWLRLEDALDAEIVALADRFAERRANGEDISEAALFRMNRYWRLLRRLQDETGQYSDYADQLITGEQRELGRLGIRHASQAIRAQYEGVGAFFDVLPVDAIENMVGLAGDGSPLRRLLQQSWPDAADGLTQALIRGTALGRNPRVTAREMRRGMASGLDRALTIARTEQLRVYREASRQQYITSGVVSSYRRLAARNDRTCAPCLALDGTEYPLDEPFADHPCGRCASVPQVVGRPPVTWESGRDWLERQDEATQRRIMGDGYYTAWQEGQFDLDQMVTVRRSATWGDAPQLTPLSELVN